MSGAYTTGGREMNIAPNIHLIFTAQIVAEQPPAVLILVAIDTEVFPIGAVRGIISVVPVFMVDGQEMPVLILELSPAFGAYEAVYFKRPLPVIT